MREADDTRVRIHRHVARLSPALHLLTLLFAQYLDALECIEVIAAQEGRKHGHGFITLFQLCHMISALDQRKGGIGATRSEEGIFKRQREAVELAGRHQGLARGVAQNGLHFEQAGDIDAIALLLVGMKAAHLAMKETAGDIGNFGFFQARMIDQIEHYGLTKLVQTALVQHLE